MATTDWTALTNSLDSSLVTRGPTSGITPPNGGSSFVWGFHSIGDADGAVALYVDATNNPNFDPLAPAGTGCSIRAAITKLSSAQGSGFSAFLIALLQGTDIDDNAYMLGFEDADPARIVLRKGSVVLGIPAATATNSLLRSNKYYNVDEWAHIRLDAIVEPSGDVVLQCFENDLLVHAVSSPVWTAMDGCEEYVDDVLGIHSGSLPYVGGRVGFGFQVDGISRRSAIDYIVAQRQT